jgi:hypothetical protein
MKASRRLAAVLQEDRESLEESKFPMHLAAEADETVGKAYLKLVSFKQAMDRMEEIPDDLMPFYRQIMKAMGSVGKVRDETAQLRGMIRKYANRLR